MPGKTVAYILAGGHVGKYGVLTMNRAKAALPFAGMFRIIDFAISNLRNSGVEQIGIIIQYLPKSLIEHVEVGLSWDLYGHGRILKIMPPFVGVGKTEWYKGTGDAIYQNLDFVRNWEAENVLIVSGEHIYNVDFQDVVRFHRENDADLTLVSQNLPEEKISPRFGRVVCDAENLHVKEFVEKPPSHPSHQISIGMSLFKTDVLLDLLQKMVDSNLGHNLSADVIARAPEKYRVFNYDFKGYWNYLETVEDYYEANMSFLNEENPLDTSDWEILTNPEDRDVGYRTPSHFGRNAYVERSLISPGCHIYGHVSNTVLSPGVVVEEGASVKDSILFHDCRIGKDVQLQSVVSDKDAVYADGSHVGQMGAGSDGDGDKKKKLNLTLIGKGAAIDTRKKQPTVSRS